MHVASPRRQPSNNKRGGNGSNQSSHRGRSGVDLELSVLAKAWHTCNTWSRRHFWVRGSSSSCLQNTEEIRQALSPTSAANICSAAPNCTAPALPSPLVDGTAQIGSDRVRDIKKMFDMLAQLLKDLQGGAHDDDDGRSVASGNRGNRHGRCYKCGERGHFKRDCPKLRREPTAEHALLADIGVEDDDLL
ncbi:hypothetical protein D1007_03948 [Hordeum vulgare]|nr:hypothetical protein D1007_03948 [Hordeum vulgare]